MSVIKSLRTISKMEFYKTAIKIRKELTIWMIKDFGAKRNPKSVMQVIKDISDDDRQIMNEIFEKYGVSPNKAFQSGYPEWFLDFERKNISDCLVNLIQNITQANSIYPRNGYEFIFEWDLRRSYQDKAIAACYNLYQELQYIVSLFPTDLNKFIYILDDIEKEVELLKDWRQADNKRRPKREN